jgi:hypothetical protein
MAQPDVHVFLTCLHRFLTCSNSSATGSRLKRLHAMHTATVGATNKTVQELPPPVAASAQPAGLS